MNPSALSCEPTEDIPHSLTFIGILPLVSDLANGSRECAIEDARFVRSVLTARRGKRPLQQLSDLEYGDRAKINYSFFFPITSGPLLDAKVILTLGVQIQPAFLPQHVYSLPA